MVKLKPYPAYKDSGVPWLGKVPEHWTMERAKWLLTKMSRPVEQGDEVVTCFRDGVVTLRKNRRLRGFTESIQEIGYQGIRKGDLVIHAMDAFAGAIGVSDSDGKGSPVYAVCRPNLGINPFYYALVVREMARAQWILALARGIRERSTDFRYETFGTQLVPVPGPEEQQAISRFMNHVDTRIRCYLRAKQKQITLLNNQKQAIIQHAVTKGLDPAAPLKPSGVQWLGDVPRHWEVLSLKRVLRRLIDCEHKTAPHVDESDCRVVRTTAIRNGSLRLDGTYCTTAEAFNDWTRRGVPQAGDVIFTREAPAGEACVVPANMQVCLGQRTVLMKVNPELYNSQFLVHMIYGGPPMHSIRLASQGSTVAHFNVDDIASMIVFAPPLNEQKEIVEYVDNATRSLNLFEERIRREIDLLREYRTRLTADVVTGKLDVRETVASLPEELETLEAEDLDTERESDDHEEEAAEPEEA